MKQNSTLPPYFLADQRFSFTLNNLLGKGATGNVYKGIFFLIQGHDHRQNKPVAIKVIETGKMNQVEKSLIENQKQALRILKHDHIMKLHHIEEQQDHTFIISQIYEGGNLKEYLQKKGTPQFISGRFSEQEAMEFFRKIILGYCAVVEANIIHRDLKPTNILLTANNEPVIIDFGYSQIIVANKNLTVFNVGSPSYMSPEAYNKTIYSEKSDVWSLGAIFYEILMNTTLDKDMPIKQYFQQLATLDYPAINFDMFGEVSKEILRGTLAVRPEQRITSHRIKYLLDKEIIGKKLMNKVVTQISNQNNGNKKNTQNVKSMKNFEFMVKEVDFTKLRAEEDIKNMKRKPGTSKTVALPLNLNDQTSVKMIPFTSAEVIQGMIKKESSKGSIEKKSQEIGSGQKIQSSSVKNTPSISRIDFKQLDPSKNAMSTICYADRRHDTQGMNGASNLTMGARQMTKNMSTIQIFNQGFRNTMAPSTNVDTTNGSLYFNEYFNDSSKEPQFLAYNEGMYGPTQNKNIGMVSSVDRKNFAPQNDKSLAYSGQVKAGATRYVNYETEHIGGSNGFYDFDNRKSSNQHLEISKNFERRRSSKRLSIAQNFKDKPQNQSQPQNRYYLTEHLSSSYEYDDSSANQALSAKRNENSQFKLSFKSITPVNHTDAREGELKNLNKPKRPENNFGSQNIINFSQMPQPSQAPKYQDMAPKGYQNNQNIQTPVYQKPNYPPKPVSSTQISYGFDRPQVQNQNWMNQPLFQYQQGVCHLRNLSEADTRNILSLRKII